MLTYLVYYRYTPFDKFLHTILYDYDHVQYCIGKFGKTKDTYFGLPFDHIEVKEIFIPIDQLTKNLQLLEWKD